SDSGGRPRWALFAHTCGSGSSGRAAVVVLFTPPHHRRRAPGGSVVAGPPPVHPPWTNRYGRSPLLARRHRSGSRPTGSGRGQRKPPSVAVATFPARSRDGAAPPRAARRAEAPAAPTGR